MKTFEIEYTTDLDDRHTTTAEGKTLTEAYMNFVCANPKAIIITDMKEICKENKMANLRSENGVHIVRFNGVEKTFLSLLNALNYINKESDECISI